MRNGNFGLDGENECRADIGTENGWTPTGKDNHHGPRSPPGAIGRFLVPDPLPERNLPHLAASQPLAAIQHLAASQPMSREPTNERHFLPHLSGRAALSLVGGRTRRVTGGVEEEREALGESIAPMPPSANSSVGDV